VPVHAPRNSLTRRCIHESGSARRKGGGKKKKKVKGKREEKVIARNVHYLSEGEEKEEERLTFRQIERKARREIFKARRYNYDVARYILLLISRVSCESRLGLSVFYRRANPRPRIRGFEIVFPTFYFRCIHKLIIFFIGHKMLE